MVARSSKRLVFVRSAGQREPLLSCFLPEVGVRPTEAERCQIKAANF